MPGPPAAPAMKRLCRHIQSVEQDIPLCRVQGMSAGTQEGDDATQIDLAPQKTHGGWRGTPVTHRTAKAQSKGIFRTEYVTVNTSWLAWIVGHMKLAATVGTPQVANPISDMLIKLEKGEPETGIQGQ